ncbi:hypothetical protein HELRODRAFT_91793, partial [Helobdella robusta]|uniref:Uncharacterized protein n=1 Tax=Helobdella robusta TaxID=6412 RepID=T1G892_HELRO
KDPPNHPEDLLNHPVDSSNYPEDHSNHPENPSNHPEDLSNHQCYDLCYSVWSNFSEVVLHLEAVLIPEDNHT